MDLLSNYTFDSIDCFVCAEHDDERAVESIMKILSSGIKIQDAIIIKYDNGNQPSRLKELLPEGSKEIMVLQDIGSFIKQFKDIINPYINKKLVIDMSCIRIPDVFSILKILKLKEHKEEFSCLYSVPYDYEYFAGDFSYKSSLGDLQNYELMGYSGDYDSTVADATYIIFLGFEGNQSLKVLEEAAYNRLTFVNSLPSLYQKYKDMSIMNNRSVITGKKHDSILYAPADNPFEVYNFLEEKFAGLSSICISPLGTKPVALGVCLFALDYENVRIVYPISDVYSPHVTNRVIKTWVYGISLF